MTLFDKEKLENLHRQNTADKTQTLLDQAQSGRKLSFKNLLSIEDLTDTDMSLIFDLTWIFKHHVLPHSDKKKMQYLRGTSIINFFCEESTRTRSSFELAGKHLGSDTININGKGSSMSKKGETLNDTARTLNKLHADCIIIRDKHSMAPAMIAKEISAPVINAGDGWHEHPSQGLLDGYTILEQFEKTEGKTIAVVGDIVHSRVAGSLLRMAKRLGMKIRMVGPRTMIPTNAKEVFGAEIFYDMEDGIRDADVAYILRVQTERAADSYIPSIRDYSKLYCMNRYRLPLISANGIVMHAGPINREVDLATEVMESDQSRVEDQVQNGIAIRMALLYLLVNRKV